MKEAITIDRLSSGAFAVNFKFNLDGDFVRTCDARGSFCINDYSNFAPSITNLLVDSEIGVSLSWKVFCIVRYSQIIAE